MLRVKVGTTDAIFSLFRFTSSPLLLALAAATQQPWQHLQMPGDVTPLAAASLSPLQLKPYETRILVVRYAGM